MTIKRPTEQQVYQHISMSILLKEDACVSLTNREELMEKKNCRLLIETQWNTEISSLAFKNLSEERWMKPAMLTLTSDIKKLKITVPKLQISIYT